MNSLKIELPQELKTDLNFIKSELKNLKKNLQPKQPTEYVTRDYVANEMLHVNLTTLHNLTKRDVLTKYQIGGRVLYRRDEVEKAIVKLKN